MTNGSYSSAAIYDLDDSQKGFLCKWSKVQISCLSDRFLINFSNILYVFATQTFDRTEIHSRVSHGVGEMFNGSIYLWKKCIRKQPISVLLWIWRF